MRKHLGTNKRRLSPTGVLLAEPVSKPVLRIVPNMGDVTEGQDVTLVCSVLRGTAPILFTWHHTEGGPIANRTSDKLEASYKIIKVRAQQQGAYYCVCTNPASETKHSQRVTIGGTLHRSRG